MATTKLQQRENSTARMLHAAMIEFAQKGFSGARVTEIARLSDVSPGLLAQRFGGKEELFLEVVQDLIDFFLEELKDVTSAEDVFRYTVNLLKTEAINDKELRFGMGISLFSTRDVPAKAMEMMREQFMKSNMYQMLQDSIDAGLLVNSDPCTIMYTFIRSTALICRSFYDSNVPIPEDDYFIQLIGFRNKNGELAAVTREQKIRTVSDILTSEYTALYYVDLKTFQFELYSMNDRIKGDTGKLVTKVRQGASAFELFVDASVYPEDKPMMMEILSSIRHKLMHKKSFSCYFRRAYENEYLYTEMKIVKIDDQDSDPTAVVVAFAEKDKQYREEKRLQAATERNAKIIQTLATEYSAVFYVNVSDRQVVSYTKNPESNHVVMVADENNGMDIDEVFGRMVNQFVYTADRERILQEGRFDNVLEKLRKRKSIDIVFRVLVPTGMEYRKLRFIKADDINEEPTAVSVALVSANNEIIGDFINERLLDEYASVYFADLENNYITAYKQSTSMPVGRFIAGPYDQVVESFAKEVDEEDFNTMMQIASPRKCQQFLAEEDFREIVYRISHLEHPWRRAILRVVERKDGVPATIIVTFMGIDHMAADQMELNAKIAEQKKELELQHHLLVEARSIAESASQAKTDFLFNMSHDIRTPMNAIKGYSTLALSHLSDTERVEDCLNKIAISSTHLEQLLDDVLDMSKIESNQVVIDPKPVNISEYCDRILDICRVCAENKQITLHCSADGVSHPLAYVDDFHVRQVLINVLNNAIKYSEANSDIFFIVSEEAGSAPGFGNYTFMIRDHGIGMTKEFLPHIFDAFAREKNTTLSGVEGTGLGMAIVHKLVDLMDGTIQIDSEVGVGTTVQVTLPFRIQAEDVKPMVTERAGDVERLKGRRILVVEDNVMNREIIGDLLQDAGLLTEEAEDGDIAVSKVCSSQPGTYDAILMDIQMPRMNGYEATKKIRELEKTSLSNIPIIAMTAHAFDEDKKRSAECGMNGHLAKPIDINKVLQILAKVIDNE
ncbi:MAG: response regulator [Lachnospiraceae bacterium]|nr:response regulator [Lachnospiraceae bacterium]